MRVALDTNVLAYLEGVNDDAHRIAAEQTLRGIGEDKVVLPIQALAELFFVLIRRAKRKKDEAQRRVSGWIDGYDTVGTTEKVLTDATVLSALYELQIFDAIILASAADGGCSLLLSEDMHQGFTWKGCTVVNPFAKIVHPLLAAAMNSRP